MPQKPETNYAFIDAQNLYRGTTDRLGWKLDYGRFRSYLREKYGVGTAYMFMGYMPEQGSLYRSLQKDGFVLVFKEVLRHGDGKVKGNVDAELVLQAMIDIDEYEQAVIVSSDGDFACLVKYLRGRGKLKAVVSPVDRKQTSVLLRKASPHELVALSDLRNRLEFKKKHPPEGEAC